MSTEAERHRRVKELFLEAAEFDEESRKAFLDEACADDGAVRRQVETMLALDGGTATFLDRGAEALLRTALEPGERVAGERGYRILQPLGEGGMGRVYLAERIGESFSQRVALKVLAGTFRDDEARRRFDAERQVLSRLEHPGIARLIDGGSLDDGSPFLAMEYVDGRPLDVAAREDGLSLEDRIRLVLDVCDAVEAAHRSLVVHRDLKPSNILVARDGSPRLLDFGIAKSLDPEVDASLTVAGLQPFTPRYGSPEQILGEPVTVATDVYSLGVLLFELFTDASPYSEEDLSPPGRLLLAVCQSDPKPPSSSGNLAGAPSESTRREAARRLRGDLDAIVLKALRKRPEDRYGSVAELAADLRRHLDGLPVLARQGGAAYRAGRFVRRHRLGVLAATVIAGLLVAWVWTLRSQLERVERERTKAETVTSFLTDLFSTADPYRTPGEPVDALQVLEMGSERIDRELSASPEVAATLHHTIGDAFANLGDAERARDSLGRAYELSKQAWGPEALETLDELGRLAELDVQVGSFQAAVDRLEPVLKDWSFSPNFEVRGHLLEVVGRAHLNLENFGAAREALEEAIRIRRLLGESTASDLASSLSSLALLHHQHNEFAAAVALYRESLELMIRSLGEKHPEALKVAENLANTLTYLDRLDEAAEIYERSLAIRTSDLGPDHWSLVRVMGNLAWVRSRQRRLDEAADLYRRSVELQRRSQSPNWLAESWFLMSLSDVESSRRNYSAAESAARESLAVVDDDDSNVFSQATVSLAMALAGRGESSEASSLVMALQLPPDASLRPYALDVLAECALAEGAAAEAVEAARDAHTAWIDQAAAVPEGSESAFDPYFAEAELRLGKALILAGQPDAEEWLRSALDRAMRLGGEDDPIAIEAQAALDRLASLR